MWNAIGSKAQKVTQHISSTVAEIQKDIKEHRSRGGDGHGGIVFNEAEAYKQMLVSFQIDQAKLGKEMQAALREKEDEAAHWKRLYTKASGEADSGAGENGDGDAAGALGVDELIKLRAEVDVLTSVNQEWENKLKEAFRKSTEEAASRMNLEHEIAELSVKVKDLDRARAASEDLIVSLSAEKTRMLGSSGEANETIDSLVDEYSRLAAEHQAQRQMDAETIQRLENVRDELVEKLKAHERNILQLVQRAEEGTAMSQRDMTESDDAAKPRSAEKGASSAGGADMGELEKKLEEQAAELRAEKEAALASLRQIMSLEMAETIKREKEAALSLAADGHAAALKRAVDESTAAAQSRAAVALEAALSQAKEQALEEKIAAVEAIVEKARKEAEAEMKKASDAHADLMKQSEDAREELRERLEKEAEARLSAVRQEMGEAIEAAKKAGEETNALYAKEYRARKSIHNRLMELQGNIRVLARVRPMLEVELSSGKDTNVTSFPADDDIIISKPKERLSGSSGGRGGDETTDTRFEFDRVFKQGSSQENVYEAVMPLVTSVLDGYNVCIFAYGQTGSGKTFTMEGPDLNPGVNTRALNDMFRIAQDRSEDVAYTFHMSMMEIYNETVFDLLRADNASKTSLDIRQRAGGGTNVPGLTEVSVDSMEEVRAQLERGSKNRAVGAHDMNEHSSRSHMIFNVRVEGTNLHTGAVLRSKLNLIDLAGSERISKTDATGDRLREAQNINRSLSALGDVISALSQNKGHVPFRNSKLTFVLQDALSGNSKVLMFVNVSPASYNVTETICSLNFAARCRSIKLGAASKNQEPAEIARYRRISEALHGQLVAAGMTPSVTLGDLSSSPSPSKISASRRKSLY